MTNKVTPSALKLSGKKAQGVEEHTLTCLRPKETHEMMVGIDLETGKPVDIYVYADQIEKDSGLYRETEKTRLRWVPSTNPVFARAQGPSLDAILKLMKRRGFQ